jgi:3-oxoacyl-[acyl-carrier-protein] synthase II
VSGDSGICAIPFWDATGYNVKVAAPIGPIRPADDLRAHSHARRAVRLFFQTVSEAFADASLDHSPLPEQRIGLAAGASVNYIDHRLMAPYFASSTNQYQAIDVARLGTELKDPSIFFRRQGETMLALPARRFSLGGPALLIDTACAASSHAIGEAFRLVQSGTVDAMIAGGAAALVAPIGILAFDLIGALSRNPDPREASWPFDWKRDGFVMGEGSGAIVLESLNSARSRGVRSYAELAGYSNNLNAHSLTDPSPDGASEARSISNALKDAGLAPEEIDYVAAHGTSTPKNDAVETQAIKRAFGAHAGRLLVSSNKGQIGHTISAAGVFNVACAALAIAEQCVPPTANLKNPDPECDLDYVPGMGRGAPVRAAIANAFAFGGQNAVLVLRSQAGL